MRLVLEEAGADVTCAENGQLGLDAALRGQFDVILMDMQMPVMDGYTAAEGVRLPRVPAADPAAHGPRDARRPGKMLGRRLHGLSDEADQHRSNYSMLSPML